MTITCCRDCDRRHCGCHSICEEYKRQRKELDEYKVRAAEQNRLTSYTMKTLRDATYIPRKHKQYFRKHW